MFRGILPTAGVVGLLFTVSGAYAASPFAQCHVVVGPSLDKDAVTQWPGSVAPCKPKEIAIGGACGTDEKSGKTSTFLFDYDPKAPGKLDKAIDYASNNSGKPQPTKKPNAYACINGGGTFSNVIAQAMCCPL